MTNLKLGSCCACGREPSRGNQVRTIVTLDYKMPPGFGPGWGCVICGLAPEGAAAVVCDDCTEHGLVGDYAVRFIMTGEENKLGRLAITEFEHVPHYCDALAHLEQFE